MVYTYTYVIRSDIKDLYKSILEELIFYVVGRIVQHY